MKKNTPLTLSRHPSLELKKKNFVYFKTKTFSSLAEKRNPFLCFVEAYWTIYDR